MSDVLITGIPRSGTTLTSALLDGLPDTVSLNEPDWQTGKIALNAEHYARWLVGDFIAVRSKILRGEPLPERRKPGGELVTNYFSTDPATQRMRSDYKIVPFTRAGLSGDFTLCIKHNGPYLGALPDIIAMEWFTVVAVFRHPVSVIHSWRSLELPISRGEMPNAAFYWPQMAQLIATPMELLEKQVRMYDLMCERLWECRAHIHLLPYETLIRRPEVLCDYIGVQGMVNKELIGHSIREIPPEQQERITDALKKYGRSYRYFYPEL